MAKAEKVKKPLWKRWWVWVLGIIIIAGIAGGDEEEITTKEETATKEEPQAKEASTEPKKEEKKQEFTVGQEVKVGNLTYKVEGVQETNKITNILGDKTTSGKFAVVTLTIKNGDKKARMADSNMFKIKTADGTEYEADAELDIYVNEAGESFFLQDINPNISKTGKVVFELPTEATEYNLEVSSGFGWSSGEYEQIKLK
jgi:hypothetical protein